VISALQRLRSGAATPGLELDDAALARLERYLEELLRWKSRLNLIGAETAETIVSRHFLESLLPLETGRLVPGGRVVDVGTGAGFPGVLLKLVRPDLKMTLVESSRRRTAFLEHLCTALRADNLGVVWGRAENLAHDAKMREAFDCAVARAVASVPVVAELTLPFVTIGGAAILMKGPEAPDELTGSRRLIEALGGRSADVLRRDPQGSGRAQVLLVLHKAQSTPAAFPRRAVKLGRIP
jgi:16S rRNA (guanine527-N7)-methyltransferase